MSCHFGHQKSLEWRKATRTYLLCKQRCAKEGIPFDLTHAWYHNKYKKGICEITGIKFELEGPRSPWSASVDRINPKLGYVEANCRMVVLIFNIARNNFSDEELLHLAKYVVLNKDKLMLSVMT